MASKTYNVLFIVAMLLLSSCSVFRGLALDGPSGPDIYEYETNRFVFHLRHRIVV